MTGDRRDRDRAPAFHRDTRVHGAVDEEFAFHLESRTRDLIAQGWTPAAARAEALRRFGDLDDARRYCERTDHQRIRRMLRLEYVREFAHDLAYAVRSLRKAPTFTLFAVLTLALGIGANTAIFSVVRGILLRPLPFAAPDALVSVWAVGNGRRFPYFSPPNLADIRDQNRTMSDIAFFSGNSAVLTGAGDPVQVQMQDVTRNFFGVLGVRPLAGRLAFTEAEDAPGGAHSVILGETLWRSRFSGDTAIVGKTITLDGAPVQVVGIAPADATWPAGTEAWTPLQLDPSKVSRGAVYIRDVARLKPGVTVEQAVADVRAIAARIGAQYPDYAKELGTDVLPLRESITGPVERPLYILLGAVALVLLIACANVANLLLVRSVSRSTELAVRAALGAGRGRLVRQLVTESVLLSVVGGAIGTTLAVVAVRALVAAAPPNIPRLDAVHLDGTVLGVTIAVTLLTGIVFGLVPARELLRVDVGTTLREGGRGARGSRASARTRVGLVVAEVALAVMLVVGAGLLVQSFRRLMAVDPGFRGDRVATFALSLPAATYADNARKSAFAADLDARLRALPGVQDVGLTIALPLTSFGFDFSFTIPEHPPVRPEDEPSMQVRVATPGYFTTLGIPVLRGRGFGEADRVGTPRAILITDAAAAKYFPGEDAIGKHLSIGWGDGAGGQIKGEIVGVVRDVKQSSLAEAPRPEMYLAYAQRPVGSFAMVVRTSGDPSEALRAARAAVHALDPSLAISRERTMDAVVASSVAEPRFYMTLLAGFAALALVLSAVGIYGVIAYVVGQRSREIGIRIALGATGRDVLAMVVGQGVGMTAVGVVIGIGGAAALTKFMDRLLFDVKPTDLSTYGTTIVVLVAVAALASLVPALRAARSDPTVAIRAE